MLILLCNVTLRTLEMLKGSCREVVPENFGFNSSCSCVGHGFVLVLVLLVLLEVVQS